MTSNPHKNLSTAPLSLSKKLSIVIPTYKRPTTILSTLKEIVTRIGDPKLRIRVHIDAGDSETLSALNNCLIEGLDYVASTSPQGPGGGRNLLIRAAPTSSVVSLDDDSWPMDASFLFEAGRLLDLHPDVAVIGTQVTMPGGVNQAPSDYLEEVSTFENCGAIIRREAFLQIGGYVPLRYAYGMEEADMSLQLMDRGWKIARTSSLRVFHNTTLAHHVSAEINAAHIANTALLAFLRYPARYWLLGALQVANRVRYAISRGRWNGLLAGIVSIPAHCWKHRRHRQPVKPETVSRARRLAKHPVPLLPR